MRASSLVVVLPLFHVITVTAQVPTCVLRCKDEHMLKSANMHLESEWSQDFAFPLVSLLKSNGSVSAATQRLVDICSSNMQFSACLKRCPESIERNIIATGLQPWIDLCQHIDSLRNELPCWKKYIRELANTCELETFEVRKSMEILSRNASLAAVAHICRFMEELSYCTVREYSKRCGESTQKIVVNLFTSARSTFTKMLTMKWKELPDACTRPVENSTMAERRLTVRDSSAVPRSYLRFAIVIVVILAGI
uniref:CPG4 domain-containing protein n=1 Tax=Steinernema glaseri TaxID=37863 RepID=A0A1I7ZUA7_9BILA